ncbi:unnamed protein product, partial [Staurois parvus]
MRGDQRVNCVICVCVLHCKHTALDGCAVHSHPKQYARADRENCFVYKQFSPQLEMLGN